jgi:mRNA interferase MazF
MIDFKQGDIIKISGFQNKFLIVSKNAFIKATKVIHVCPIIQNIPEGPLHIRVDGKIKETGIVACEQIKLIDPSVRGCGIIDSIPYDTIMNVSDALQGIFEYD